MKSSSTLPSIRPEDSVPVSLEPLTDTVDIGTTIAQLRSFGFGVPTCIEIERLSCDGGTSKKVTKVVSPKKT